MKIMNIIITSFGFYIPLRQMGTPKYEQGDTICYKKKYRFFMPHLSALKTYGRTGDFEYVIGLRIRMFYTMKNSLSSSWHVSNSYNASLLERKMTLCRLVLIEKNIDNV